MIASRKQVITDAGSAHINSAETEVVSRVIFHVAIAIWVCAWVLVWVVIWTHCEVVD
jgi:hypothetical protein